MNARLQASPACAYTPGHIQNMGDERDEYPSPADTETRWLVETGTAAKGNGLGSLRTKRGTATRRRK